ncbi:ATP synthase j chain-domain-containing protein [Podospora appendiculata]|uniref:ATP synthase j chain-domain-containing protein n=1 Tax=Podospora appendiculata TaxID=314037 RepID=A0AAE0XMU2_9PEZI|nr:ATP synthase j chain-domain-containing protein [Podospora appendiculata]
MSELLASGALAEPLSGLDRCKSGQTFPRAEHTFFRPEAATLGSRLLRDRRDASLVFAYLDSSSLLAPKPDFLPILQYTATATMSWFGVTPLKKFPAPVLRPMAPFFAAGLVIAYGINAAQTSMMKGDEWKNDPRNVYAKSSSH